jgi:hypothetical protein
MVAVNKALAANKGENFSSINLIPISGDITKTIKKK